MHAHSWKCTMPPCAGSQPRIMRQKLLDWAPLPVTQTGIERFLANPDSEIRVVAEIDGAIVGIGALVLANCELRACYVAPEAARKGVGSALVAEIERIARDH